MCQIMFAKSKERKGLKEISLFDQHESKFPSSKTFKTKLLTTFETYMASRVLKIGNDMSHIILAEATS